MCVQTVWLSTLLFFFNDTATTEIYTLSLHDALPIFGDRRSGSQGGFAPVALADPHGQDGEERLGLGARVVGGPGSEEHTSELQSRQYLVCRLLLEKKKKDLHDYKHAHVLLEIGREHV